MSGTNGVADKLRCLAPAMRIGLVCAVTAACVSWLPGGAAARPVPSSDVTRPATTAPVSSSAIQPRIVGGVVNGGFETGNLTGWTVVGAASVVSSGAHSGTYAASVGQNPTLGDSSISQTFTAPTGTNTLSFWYNMVTCTNLLSLDWTTVTLKDVTTSVTTTPLAKTCVSNSGWQQISVAVTAGDTYLLTMTTHAGGVVLDLTHTLFDDVATTGLTIAKTADTAATEPGSTVHYTVTVTNAGQTPYTGATFSDSLAGMLDDAVYNNNASATTGSIAYTSPNLTWTGDLAVGAVATISYSATVSVPFTSTAVNQGSTDCLNDPNPSVIATQLNQLTCNAGASQNWTFTPVPGAPASYTIASSAGHCINVNGFSTADNAAVIQYTCNNQGNEQFALHPVSSAAKTYELMALNSGKCVAPAGDSTASGALLVQLPCSSAASRVWKLPGSGDKTMTNTITSSTPGNNCFVGNADSRCVVSFPVLVPWLVFAKTADTASTTPGSTVHYTVTATNAGQTTYTGATFSDSLAGVLDDAVYNNNATATAGTARVYVTQPDVVGQSSRWGRQRRSHTRLPSTTRTPATDT